jgi:hypothetical protein
MASMQRTNNEGRTDRVEVLANRIIATPIVNALSQRIGMIVPRLYRETLTRQLTGLIDQYDAHNRQIFPCCGSPCRLEKKSTYKLRSTEPESEVFGRS